jgi:hypothetical protein
MPTEKQFEKMAAEAARYPQVKAALRAEGERRKS